MSHYLAYVSEDIRILDRNMLHCDLLKLQLIFKRTDWYFLYLKFLDSHGGSGSREPCLSRSQDATSLFFSFPPKIKLWKHLFIQNTGTWKRAHGWLFHTPDLCLHDCVFLSWKVIAPFFCLFQLSNDCVLNTVQISCLRHCSVLRHHYLRSSILGMKKQSPEGGSWSGAFHHSRRVL